MEERVNCLCVIFEGPPSSGKTFILNALDPKKDFNPSQYLYRTDKFTPASFLSHAADKTEAELNKIDMLPRIAHKLLVTPELSEMFGEDEHRLRSNFATLTSVLDGSGQTTDSGAQGRRQVIGDYTFNWLGATTQIAQRVFDVMGTMGSRLLLFEFPEDPVKRDEAADWLMGYHPKQVGDKLRTVTLAFVEEFFNLHPVSTVPVDEVVLDRPIVDELTRYAHLIAAGRKIHQQEGLQRLQLLLRMLVQGSAIIHERYIVNAYDMEILKHVSISTIPHVRRAILRALQSRGMAHRATQPGVGLFTKVQLDDFVSTNIARWVGNSIVLAKDWRWVA